MTDVKLPNRQMLHEILEDRINNNRRRVKIAKLMEPFFVRAETGIYQLYRRKQLNKRRVVSALNKSLRVNSRRLEFCSVARPVPRQPWMTHDAYMALLNDYMLRCIWTSTSDLGMRSALKDAYRQYLNHNYPDLLAEADDILQDFFGNSLWKSSNESMFSGVGYVLEESLKYFFAFQLTNNANIQQWLDSLMRLLPRAIPLGIRTDRQDTWVVLVA